VIATVLYTGDGDEVLIEGRSLLPDLEQEEIVAISDKRITFPKTKDFTSFINKLF